MMAGPVRPVGTATVMAGVVAVVLAAILAAATPQEGSWTEKRLIRITLKNGSVLEGDGIRQGPDRVVLVMQSGEVSLRRESIERIEERKIRVALPAPEPPRVKPPPMKAPPQDPVGAEIRERMDAILASYRQASDWRRHDLARELAGIAPLGIPHLVRRFESLDESTRALTAGALAQCRELLTAAALEPLLRSGKPSVRIEAAKLLGLAADPAAASALSMLIADAQPDVRMAAVQALAAIGTREAFRSVAASCADSSRPVRLAALQALPALAGRNDCPEAMDSALLEAFDLTRAEARADVVSVMGISKRPGLARYLVDALRDESPVVRAAVVTALVNLGAQPWRAWIVDRFIREEETIVRLALADAALALKLHEAIEPLIGWLESRDRTVAAAARRSLRGLTEQDFGSNPAPWRTWWDTVKPK